MALRYSLKVKLVCGLAAAGAYFAAALWLKASYVDPAPQGSLVIQLLPPFSNEGGYSWRVTSPLPAAWTRMAGAEPAMIYEGDYPLVFRDSNWREISTVGQGHFLIEGNVIMFSTSDNSDPATNGRYYWAVVPR